MEKFIQKNSGINKIIGAESEKQESDLLGFFAKEINNTNDKTKEFERVELKKSPETRKLISDIIKNMGEFLLQYGVKAVNVSPDNIAMLDYSKLTDEQKEEIKKENNQGGYYPWRQKIIANIDITKKSSAELTEIIAHELIHLNSFQSLQTTSKDDREMVLQRAKSKELAYLKRRRIGLSIKDKENKELGVFIDEATTSELTARFCDFFFSKNETLKEAAEKKKKFIEENVPPQKKAEAQNDILEVKTKQQESGEYKTEIISYSYPKWREALNIIIDELFERNKDKFSSREEIFNLFADAHFSGKLLPLARLLEKSYSKGFFRFLSEISKKERS